MDRLHRAIKNVHRLDDLAARGTALTRLPPLPKLLAVLVYLCVTLSFQKYALTGLLSMALWPILLYEIDDLSIVKTLRQCWAVVALLVVMNIAGVGDMMVPLMIAILCAGALASARLYLGCHNGQQVLAGFCGGFAVAALAVLFL